MTQPPQNPDEILKSKLSNPVEPNFKKDLDISTDFDEIKEVEELVKEKYHEIKSFYDDINDPSNIVPKRDELRKSLNDLLLAEEKVKFNEMTLYYDERMIQYKRIITNLLDIIKILLNIND